MACGGHGQNDELEHLENGLGSKNADVEEWVRRQVKNENQNSTEETYEKICVHS